MPPENSSPSDDLRRPLPSVLVVGNYCHDLLSFHPSPTLGGAASFVSNVLHSLSLPSPLRFVSKAGTDFAFRPSHPPIVSPDAPTTVFRAVFEPNGDRLLTRLAACDPILPSDLPPDRSRFGLAVGVGGEVLPETLARLLDLCDVVFVDVQGLIRTFDPVNGAVGLVPLLSSAFAGLLPRIGFLKASSEEAAFVDVEEVRKLCCVVVTEGKEGCRVCWGDGEVKVSAFPAVQVDPTGAGDSFLGGFVAGLCWGLTVPDAALLGNFFGSLTVEQIGIPEFDQVMMQSIQEEFSRRVPQYPRSFGKDNCVVYQKSDSHEALQEFLNECRKLACASNLTDSTAGSVI